MQACSRSWLRQIYIRAGVIGGSIATALLASSLYAQPSGRYDAFEYARLEDPGASVVVRTINTSREVAGGFRQGDPRRMTRALILTGSALLDIPSELLLDFSAAYGINDQGEVAGAFNGPVGLLPFRSIRRSAFLTLPLLPGDTGGAAYAINNRGEAVGYSSGGSGERAVWWERAGAVHGLPSLSGSSTRALAINEGGDVVGVSGDSVRRAVLWPGRGSAVDLRTLPGYTHSEAAGINERGEIVGLATGIDGNPNRTHAVLWTPGGQSIRDLGTLPGGSDSRARDINARGEVVGTSTVSGGGSRAFVWTANAGMVDLNALVSLPGLVLTDAMSTNRNGDIVAIAEEQHHDAPNTTPSDHGHGNHEVPRRILILTPRLVPAPGR